MTFLDEKREQEDPVGQRLVKTTQKHLPHGGSTHEMRYKRRMQNQNGFYLKKMSFFKLHISLHKR